MLVLKDVVRPRLKPGSSGGGGTRDSFNNVQDQGFHLKKINN